MCVSDVIKKPCDVPGDANFKVVQQHVEAAEVLRIFLRRWVIVKSLFSFYVAQ